MFELGVKGGCSGVAAVVTARNCRIYREGPLFGEEPPPLTLSLGSRIASSLPMGALVHQGRAAEKDSMRLRWERPSQKV